MTVVQRPATIPNERRYSFSLIIEDSFSRMDLVIELNLLGSRIIKDTDDRPISNQGQDIR